MIPAGAPQAVHDYWNSIPQDNCGDFYAKIRAPFMPFGTWYKVPVWGQVCDGRTPLDQDVVFSMPWQGRVVIATKNP